MRNILLVMMSVLFVTACGDDNVNVPKYFVSSKLSSEETRDTVLNHIFNDEGDRLNSASKKMWKFAGKHLGVRDAEMPVMFKDKLSDTLKGLDYKALRMNYKAAQKVDFTAMLDGVYLGEHKMMLADNLDVESIQAEDNIVVIVDLADKKQHKQLHSKGIQCVDRKKLNAVMRNALTFDPMLRYFFQKPFGYHSRRKFGSELPTSRRGRLHCCVFEASALHQGIVYDIKQPIKLPVYVGIDADTNNQHLSTVFVGGIKNLQIGLKHTHSKNSQEFVVSSTYVGDHFFAEYSVGAFKPSESLGSPNMSVQNIRVGADLNWVSPFLGVAILNTQGSECKYGTAGLEIDMVNVKLGEGYYSLNGHVVVDFVPGFGALCGSVKLQQKLQLNNGGYVHSYVGLTGAKDISVGVSFSLTY